MTRSHRPLMRTFRLALPVFLLCSCVNGLHAQLHLVPPTERCFGPPRGGSSARDWLQRAATITLPPDDAGDILRYRAYHDFVLWEQSDRMYEPFIPNVSYRMVWYDLESGLTGRQPVERAAVPGSYPAELFARNEQYFIRDTLVMRLPVAGGQVGLLHTLNPWDVLRRWQSQADSVRVVASCTDRDQPRLVLSLGEERLYLASDGTPVKLQREEPHYLFGQVRAEYLWTTWWGVRGGGRYPVASFLQYDGETYHRHSLVQGSAQLVVRDSAPRFSLPRTVLPAPGGTSMTADPDTVRVSQNTWLLVTRAYTQAVTLQRDTVFLFDATSSEARARADSAWIAKLFPGMHPVVLVVTDLAWPHISGVRFWVARGATIVSHVSSEPFLRRVVERRWTRAPDALEKSRGTTRWRFVGVTDSLRLAGGAITVHALQGQSTEGAVGVWVAADLFFWAGDYVQNDPTSPYARDVARTLRSLRLQPVKVGAQHVSITDGSEFLRRQ